MAERDKEIFFQNDLSFFTRLKKATFQQYFFWYKVYHSPALFFVLWCYKNHWDKTICIPGAENEIDLEIIFKFICRDLYIQNYFRQTISAILIISNFPS